MIREQPALQYNHVDDFVCLHPICTRSHPHTHCYPYPMPKTLAYYCTIVIVVPKWTREMGFVAHLHPSLHPSFRLDQEGELANLSSAYAIKPTYEWLLLISAKFSSNLWNFPYSLFTLHPENSNSCNKKHILWRTKQKAQMFQYFQ